MERWPIAIYFQLPVRLLPSLRTTATQVKAKKAKKVAQGKRNVKEKWTASLVDEQYTYTIQCRSNEHGHPQLYDLDLIDVIAELNPADAYATLGVTPEDIYEWDDMDAIIMGRGTGDRAGLLSLYRFFAPPTGPTLALLRACKTMVHEVMHMFGLDHCVHHLCVMNANVSPDDDDADVLWLCPLDLAKLQIVVTGLDRAARYRQLAILCAEMDFQREQAWYCKSLHCCGS
eukprot:TRINITY_DN1365_c0_g1_i1.p1 TRINITY_DN1365_c0_g1~~TRINITY_DN1365_c0_g1_i1.p1  ORF type:complete len:230 (-),score=29.83 TRINITY_DN1365_c0_g1_i1:21-710(-)